MVRRGATRRGSGTALLGLVFSVSLCLCGQSIQAQDKTYSITGEVKTPGTYVYREGMSVLQAIAEAGGITECGALRRLKVRRTSNGESAEVDVTLHVKFLPEDTIVVPRRIGTPTC